MVNTARSEFQEQRRRGQTSSSWTVWWRAACESPPARRCRRLRRCIVFLAFLHAPFVSAGMAPHASLKRNAPKLTRVSVDADPCPVAFQKLQRSLSDFSGMALQEERQTLRLRETAQLRGMSPRAANQGMSDRPAAVTVSRSNQPVEVEGENTQDRAPRKGAGAMRAIHAQGPLRESGGLQKTTEPAGREEVHEPMHVRMRVPGSLR